MPYSVLKEGKCLRWRMCIWVHIVQKNLHHSPQHLVSPGSQKSSSFVCPLLVAKGFVSSLVSLFSIIWVQHGMTSFEVKTSVTTLQFSGKIGIILRGWLMSWENTVAGVFSRICFMPFMVSLNRLFSNCIDVC